MPGSGATQHDAPGGCGAAVHPPISNPNNTTRSNLTIDAMTATADRLAQAIFTQTAAGPSKSHGHSSIGTQISTPPSPVLASKSSA